MIITYGATRLQAWIRCADRLGVSRLWIMHFAAQHLLQSLPRELGELYADAMCPHFLRACQDAQLRRSLPGA